MPKGGLAKPAKASLDGILQWWAQAVELNYMSTPDHESFLNSISEIQKEIYEAEQRCQRYNLLNCLFPLKKKRVQERLQKHYGKRNQKNQTQKKK